LNNQLPQSSWHIVTCEYPPQSGGVSDYTKLVAEGLAEAGDEVHVWCPEARGEEQSAQSEGVNVHRELGRFRPSDLRRVAKQLDQFPAPRRLLVQWVPHGYGYQSMNLPFCFWLWRRAKLKGDCVELMVHEPFLAFAEGSRKQDIAAAVHRVMVIVLLNAASRIWVSTQEWKERLRFFLLGARKPIGWLPVPSNIPLVDDPAGVAQVRARYATNGTHLVGHFGAYNDYLTDVMSELLPSLLNGEGDLSMLLLGRGSIELRDRLKSSYPQLSGKVHATGELASDEVSKHVSACDVMLQPYQDGVSGRRTSVMTALSHSVPVVTTAAKATETCWMQSGAVRPAQIDDFNTLTQSVKNLLNEERLRASSGNLGRDFYLKQFDVVQTISVLRESNRVGFDEVREKNATSGSSKVKLDCTPLPDFILFAESCRHGLSAVYPFKEGNLRDPFGWKFAKASPPSYSAFGRMRSLLAIEDALRLKPRRVLEVAAGGGGLAARLAKEGCSVIVNDLRGDETKAALEEYATAANIQVVSGNLFDLSPEAIGKFDLVVACEVIEHVAHPLNLLKHLRSFLETDGRILLTTPNGSHFRNKLPTFAEVDNFTRLESQQFKPDADGHLFLFTPAELATLAEVAGLKMEQLNCWGTPILTGHCGLRFLAGPHMTRLSYRIEQRMQNASPQKRERYCFALSVIFKNPGE
jgi:2-polyprenyl-3-methyl-5-hydroxy-6-metoxy-1,4-benzoquinol methylase/glycosyltransferase involved in cell wall biosynthesis